MNAIATDPEYRALNALSARLGRNPLLVQGAGGNTSLKRDGILWVKASGTWLAQAETQPIMVPVWLDRLRDALDTPAAERAGDFVATELAPTGLRPSIETTMHAALPHAVVLHVHCVETIAWAVRADAEARLAERLEGLAWRFIPYRMPGLPLTRDILAAGPADVLVLGNHGLVVGGADVAEAEALLYEVGARLRHTPRPAPPADTERLTGWAAGFRPAEAAHGVATDPVSLALAERGSYYPDHVIFLGPGVHVRRPGDAPKAENGLVLIPEVGALLPEDASAGTVALAGCLADVLARIDADAPLTLLSREDEARLLGWDAEAYRRSLDFPAS